MERLAARSGGGEQRRGCFLVPRLQLRDAHPRSRSRGSGPRLRRPRSAHSRPEARRPPAATAGPPARADARSVLHASAYGNSAVSDQISSTLVRVKPSCSYRRIAGSFCSSTSSVTSSRRPREHRLHQRAPDARAGARPARRRGRRSSLSSPRTPRLHDPDRLPVAQGHTRARRGRRPTTSSIGRERRRVDVRSARSSPRSPALKTAASCSSVRACPQGRSFTRPPAPARSLRASNGRRSSSPSPTPTSFTGSPSSWESLLQCRPLPCHPALSARCPSRPRPAIKSRACCATQFRPFLSHPSPAEPRAERPALASAAALASHLFELVHQARLGVQPPGGIHDHDVAVGSRPRRRRRRRDRRRARRRRSRAPERSAQISSCSSAAARNVSAAPSVTARPCSRSLLRELADRRRLARAVDADDEHAPPARAADVERRRLTEERSDLLGERRARAR